MSVKGPELFSKSVGGAVLVGWAVLGLAAAHTYSQLYVSSDDRLPGPLPAPLTLRCSCKFAHPYDQAPKVEFNALGLPLRPGEPECSFYVKNFRQAPCGLCCLHAGMIAGLPRGSGGG